jgi:23S rRNA pseudouridine1911/1915/1917 synthase
MDNQAAASALRAFPRQALHAWQTTFLHPQSGKRLTIVAPLPADLAALLHSLTLDKWQAERR